MDYTNNKLKGLVELMRIIARIMFPDKIKQATWIEIKKVDIDLIINELKELRILNDKYKEVIYQRNIVNYIN